MTEIEKESRDEVAAQNATTHSENTARPSDFKGKSTGFRIHKFFIDLRLHL